MTRQHHSPRAGSCRHLRGLRRGSIPDATRVRRMPMTRPANPSAAMLVIGDEILSGRTRDSNLHHLAGELTRHGVQLREARVVADDHEAIVEALSTLRRSFDHVFTSGGIGPTHD